MRIYDNRRVQWQAAQSLCVYYGKGELDQLKAYDVAIVEPLGQNQQTVVQLQASGTLVLAYLSVIEAYTWDSKLQYATATDFLRLNNKPVTNPVYGGFIMDIRSQRWQRLIFHQAATLLAQGYDGLFLDTIDNVEAACWPLQTRLELVDSAANLVRQLRLTYPDHLLIQNNGMEMLAEQTVEHLDGVCCENPPPELCSAVTLNTLAARLSSMANHSRLRLICLLDASGEEQTLPPSLKKARCSLQSWTKQWQGFLYCAPRDYLRLPQEPLPDA